MSTPAQLRERLAEQGVSARIADAIRAIPRHLFLPTTVWEHRPGRSGNDFVPLRRDRDPDEWMRAAYADEVVITQVDHGHPAPDGTGFEPTSSVSMPTVVAQMLAALDPRPQDRVLEIGTGPGWNAALLRQLGAEVTSVEVDSQVAREARERLAGRAEVITGDGLEGWPPNAPYDRLIATVGVDTIPSAWVRQVCPGGTIVAPLTNSYEPPGVVTLTVTADGTASGRIGYPAVFMPARGGSARVRGGDFAAPVTHRSRIKLHPYHWVANRHAAVAIGQRTDGIQSVWLPNSKVQKLYHTESGSWARVDVSEEPPYPVAEAGPRRLVREILAAYRSWHEAGKPSVADWMVTVGPHGQRFDLP